ncbi:MAG: hypothetical protein KKE89_01980 [Actinobacteria bacterium]|nr:hypothetical protein [Actinomycetota bacterium]
MIHRGFVLNTSTRSTGPETTSVLYETSPEALEHNLPRLVPSWDKREWDTATCVDFWIYYHQIDGALDVHLDWWSLKRLGEFVGDGPLAAAAVSALTGGDTLDGRLKTIVTLVERAFAEAEVPAPE